MSNAEGRIATFLAQHLLDQMARQGSDVERILRAAGLQGSRLDTSAPWVPLAQCCAMIRAGIAQAGDEMLGLRLSQSAIIPTSFGIVGHIVQTCPSLADVVAAVGRYEQLIGDIFSSPLLQEPGASIWSLDIRACPPDVARYMTHLGLGTRYLLLNLVREKRANIVREIRFRHAPPHSAEARALYEKVFRCPIRFNQAHSGLVFRPEALSLPLLHVDRALKSTLEAVAEQQLARCHATPDFLTQVRSRLDILVRQGIARREALAAELGISGRHLHRELAQVGTTYSELLNDVRLARARELLASGATYEEICQQLAFQEPSSFMRWYRQRTGQSVGQVRQARGRQAMQSAEPDASADGAAPVVAGDS